MYLKFYDLRKEPFNITPDPEFLYLSGGHREALASIIYGIEKRKGFIAIIGAVGTGKTTVFRAYLDKIDKSKIRTIYIFNPNISFKSLLQAIFQELGLEPRSDDIFEMVNELHQILIAEYKQGHNVVLAIDEAQNMPLVTLENLRMLSNLETSKDKLIQIVLIGQPEFEQILAQPALRQINQRMAIRSTISPLTAKESLEYLNHRLGHAAAKPESVFSADAVKKITSQAKGIPRVMNILADNALLTGFGYQKRPVDGKIVSEIIADFEGGKKAVLPRWRYAAYGSLAIALGLLAVFELSDLRTKPGPQPVKTELPAPQAPPPVTLSIQSPQQAPAHTGAPAPAPVTAQIEGQEKPRPSSTVKIKKGDTLSALIAGRYGFVDNRIMSQVQSQNPGIKNVNKIYIGEELEFPEIDVKRPAKD